MQSLYDVLRVGQKEDPGSATTDLSLASVTPETFCRALLESAQYREYLRDRILFKTLPPAIEVLIYHYAFGKPVERVEHSGRDGKPIEITRIVREIVDTPVAA